MVPVGICGTVPEYSEPEYSEPEYAEPEYAEPEPVEPEPTKPTKPPLAKSEPVVLKPSQVVERAKSPNSIMPKGLLDKLTREEILDLVAYVAAGGDPKNPLFGSGHEHAHATGAGPGH